MKFRTFTLFATLLLVFTFACKKTEYANTDTSTSNSTTAVSASDTSGTTTTSGASLTDDEKTFMTKAAQGGMAEVNLGGVAASKATNADVKSFGQKMQTDHGQANDELKQLASSKGVTLPTEPSAEQKKTADEVSAKSGAAFDKAYMDAMVKDHDKDVKEFQEASSKVKDPDLKAWTDKTLTVIQGHDKMAHDIAGKLK